MATTRGPYYAQRGRSIRVGNQTGAVDTNGNFHPTAARPAAKAAAAKTPAGKTAAPAKKTTTLKAGAGKKFVPRGKKFVPRKAAAARSAVRTARGPAFTDASGNPLQMQSNGMYLENGIYCDPGGDLWAGQVSSYDGSFTTLEPVFQPQNYSWLLPDYVYSGTFVGTSWTNLQSMGPYDNSTGFLQPTSGAASPTQTPYQPPSFDPTYGGTIDPSTGLPVGQSPYAAPQYPYPTQPQYPTPYDPTQGGTIDPSTGLPVGQSPYPYAPPPAQYPYAAPPPAYYPQAAPPTYGVDPSTGLPVGQAPYPYAAPPAQYPYAQQPAQYPYAALPAQYPYAQQPSYAAPGVPAYDPSQAALYAGAAYGAEAAAQQAAAQQAQSGASGGIDPSTGLPVGMDPLTASILMGGGTGGIDDLSGMSGGLDPTTLAMLSGGDPDSAYAMAMQNGGYDPTGGMLSGY